MVSYRPARVGELLQEEIADLLLRHLKDPRLQLATVSRVDVTPDLRHACVYLSHPGSEVEQQAMLKGFLHASGFIRSHIGKHLRLRYAPQLTFKLDTAIAYGVRISRLLQDLTASHMTEDMTEEGKEGDSAHA
jgi:ribosome-binding factor A